MEKILMVDAVQTLLDTKQMDRALQIQPDLMRRPL